MAHKSALNGITQLYCQWNIWLDHSCIWLLYKLCFESVTYKLAYFIHTSPLTWQAIFKDKKRVTLFSSCFFFFFQVFHNWSISLSISLEDFNYIFIYNVIELTLVKFFAFMSTIIANMTVSPKPHWCLFIYLKLESETPKRDIFSPCHLGNLQQQSSPSSSFVHFREF